MFFLFISYVMVRRVVDASCLCLPVAAAATGRFHLWLPFPHGGTGEDSDGSSLSSAAEAMLGVFSGGV